MRTKEERQTELLVARRGGLTMGPGLVLMALGAGAYLLQKFYERGAPPMPGWACWLAAALGLLLCLVFGGFVFHAGKDFAEKVWGLGFPGSGLFFMMGRRRLETRGYAYVSLEMRVRVSRDQDGTGKTVTYPVVLTGGRPDLAVDEPSDYSKARRLAERVAGHLMLPLRDRSSGTLVAREPEHLNESVSQRLHRLGERPDPGMPPPGMKTRIRPGRGGTIMELPSLGFTVAHKAGLLVCLAMAALGALFRAWPMIAFCAIAALVMADNALRKSTLFISREAFEVKVRGLTGSRKKIPADLLEELTLAPGRFGEAPGPEQMDMLPAWARSLLEVFIGYRMRGRLTARSDTKTITVRMPVSSEEAEYLYQKILAALAG